VNGNGTAPEAPSASRRAHRTTLQLLLCQTKALTSDIHHVHELESRLQRNLIALPTHMLQHWKARKRPVQACACAASTGCVPTDCS
jgi:hypothetical protein